MGKINLDKIISEAIKNVLNEHTFWKLPTNINPEKFLEMVSKRDNIEPSELKIENDKLYYIPSKKKSVKRKKLVKPENMDFDTFYNQIVLPNNPEEAKKANEYGSEEEWRPLPNRNRYFKGELDPSQCIEVSNMGRIRFIDGKDGMKSGINKGVYFAPTRKGVQVHINSVGADGQPLKTTGFLANMVMDAWAETDEEFNPRDYKVKYIDGNPENCELSNLKYVRKQQGRRKATSESIVDEITNIIIEKLIRR